MSESFCKKSTRFFYAIMNRLRFNIRINISKICWVFLHNLTVLYNVKHLLQLFNIKSFPPNITQYVTREAHRNTNCIICTCLSWLKIVNDF